MKFVNLGKTNEQIPAIGMGTWQIERTPKESIEALHAGFDAGMKFVDTAETYNNEELVGRALTGFDDVFIATKVHPNNFHYADVIKSCDQSLSRLGVKTIDLYQLHKPNKNIDIKETISAMEDLVRQGKVRYIGLSNFSVDEVKEVQAALKENEIVSNQLKYNLLSRDIENSMMDFCKDNKITIIAFEPFAKGSIANDRGSKSNELLIETDKRYDKEAAQKLNIFLNEVGEKYDRNAMQLALNWIISKDNICAIPKASSSTHVLENSHSTDFVLSKEDYKKIDEFSKVLMQD
jgi:diketogulonate reductase-like aldo/keto reductase